MSLLRVLLIEDSEDDADIILRELRRTDGFEILADIVSTEKDMRSVLLRKTFDIVLCDWYLTPTFNAENAIEILGEFELDIPFILVSGKLREDMIKNFPKTGVYEYVSKDEISIRLNRVIHRELLLAQTYNSILNLLNDVLAKKHVETEEHSRRVSQMSVRLARHYGMNEIEISHLRRGALLHDVGKIGIPDSILLKPDKLSDGEWVWMKQHPQYAYDLMKNIPFLRRALNVPYCHHEHWDGSGYPRGLVGEEIPLSARIFTVIDVWDALTSERSYRKDKWSGDRALQYIQENSGKLFDPEVVKVFLSHFELVVL